MLTTELLFSRSNALTRGIAIKTTLTIEQRPVRALLSGEKRTENSSGIYSRMEIDMDLPDRELRNAAAKLAEACILAIEPDEREAAWAAYDAFDSPGLILEGDDEEISHVVRCQATGAPLWDSDEYVWDPQTGEHWLRAAIGLPPRQP